MRLSMISTVNIINLWNWHTALTLHKHINFIKKNAHISYRVTDNQNDLFKDTANKALGPFVVRGTSLNLFIPLIANVTLNEIFL